MKVPKFVLMTFSLSVIFLMSFVLKNNITTEEKENVFFMLEEEKLAHDVYVALEEKWDHHVFSNISKAEATHYEMMLDLAFEYEIEEAKLVEENPLGVFESKNHTF